jgi:hypothetical protein
MDSSTTAGNSAATGRTVGGRPVTVNFSGRRGRPPKKPSFARDDRLARDGARLMTGPFRPPGEPPFAVPAAPAAPATASASIVVAVGRPALPPPAAAATASAAVDLTFSNAGDESNDSGICVVGPPLRPAGNKGKTPFVCLTGDILRVMQDKLTANATSGNVNATSAETRRGFLRPWLGRGGTFSSLRGGLTPQWRFPKVEG